MDKEVQHAAPIPRSGSLDYLQIYTRIQTSVITPENTWICMWDSDILLIYHYYYNKKWINNLYVIMPSNKFTFKPVNFQFSCWFRNKATFPVYILILRDWPCHLVTYGTIITMFNRNQSEKLKACLHFFESVSNNLRHSKEVDSKTIHIRHVSTVSYWSYY